MANGRDLISISVDDFVNVKSIRSLFPQLQTPNYDALRAMGVSFDNTFATTALCTPSRTAILSGMSPFTTNVHSNQENWESSVNIQQTWPAILRAQGYDTYGYGKIFPGLKNTQATQVFDVFSDKNGNATQEGATSDYLNVRDAINTLKNHNGVSPLLLMVGLHDPHSPQVSPSQYTAMYPISQITVPNWETETAMPAFVVEMLDNLPNKTIDQQKQAIASYLANVTEMDARLGELLNAINAEPNFDPIITLWADHGYHMGDHEGITGKFTLWDQADRMPFVIVDPLAPASSRGTSHTSVVSGLDVGPTILDLLDVTKPIHMEGASVADVLANPSMVRAGVALTSMYGSISIRTNDYRYTRYEDGSIELFKVGPNSTDPFNLQNLANNASFDAVEAQMRARLTAELAEIKVVIDEANDIVKVNQGTGNSAYFVTPTTNLAALATLDTGGTDTIFTNVNNFNLPTWAENLRASQNWDEALKGIALNGNNAANIIIGEGGTDFISGKDGNDNINAARGNDTVFGGSGNDILYGDFGLDVLNGDKGNDTLQGGKDKDTFTFVHDTVTTSDRVLDFVKGVDILRLEGAAWRNATVTESGSNTIIKAGTHTITLEKTADYNLLLSDFTIIG